MSRMRLTIRGRWLVEGLGLVSVVLVLGIATTWASSL